MKNIPRRLFLRNALINSLILGFSVSGLLGKASIALGQDADSQLDLAILKNALRSTGNAFCLKFAEGLEASREAKADYDLHLRRADLGVSDAEIIASAIRKISLNKGPVLRSFSMSYNPGLTDTGVVALALALPHTVTELGLVECAIGDEGGTALLRWCKEVTALQMICVEGNNFSSSIRQGFTALAQTRPHLLVVV